MKLTDHAKTLSLSLTVSDDSRLGEAFLVAIAALRAMIEVGNDLDIEDFADAMFQIAEEALAEIEEL